MQGTNRVKQLVAHALREANRTDQNYVRAGRTLLTSVTERRVHNILYGQIKVSRRSDDDRVLPRSLRHDLHRRIPGAEQFSRPGRARQDNATHARVRDEVLTQRVLADGDKL
ncbi:Uncharacterised protein [Chlamydia trachomatis]|nr:Uncharacterised protein [Chlamydia trachomatis]